MKKLWLLSACALILVVGACAQGDVQQATADNEAAEETAATAQQTPPPPPPPRIAELTVNEGTLLDVALNSSLDSGANLVGDEFTAEVLSPISVDGQVAIPAGSTIHGSVTEVKKAKRGAGNATLGLAFDSIKLPGGYSTSMNASLTEQSESQKKRNAGIIGGSAAGGALLGRIIGKDTKGAVVGSLIGGAIGTGVVLSKEGEQVKLPQGTGLTLRVDAPIVIKKQLHRPS